MATVLSEGLLLGCLGGFVGAGGSWLLVSLGGWSLSAEGISLVFVPAIEVLSLSFWQPPHSV